MHMLRSTLLVVLALVVGCGQREAPPQHRSRARVHTPPAAQPPNRLTAEQGAELNNAAVEAMLEAAPPAVDDAPAPRRGPGEHVVGAFTMSGQSFVQGAPVRIRFRLENPAGAPPVVRDAWAAGGVHPLEFAFQVAREQHAVAQHVIGGHRLAGPTLFAPGTSVGTRVDLRDWADLGAPGHYSVVCRYTARFALPAENLRAARFAADGVQVYETTFEFDIR